VAGHVTVGNPLLVDATDLDLWAGTEDAPGAFPELMRRLLAQTPGVSNIDVRAHEGNAAPGWDGTATSTGSAYLPAGQLRFEFGTNKETKRKAQQDYDKRVLQTGDGAEEVFVFATPRNWAGGAAWAAGRANEGCFHSVKVIDAHTLEGWLQSLPVVHYWISERLGKHPADVRTLASWWEGFLGRARIEVPPKFHTAGRDKEKQRTLQLLKEKAPFLTVQSAWRDDALAFCHAALKEGDPAALDKTVVVWSAQAWRQLAGHSSPMILVPLFDDPDIGLADRGGHTVVRVLGGNWTSSESDTVIGLPKIRRDTGAEALVEAADIDTREADRFTALARRSMSAFYRSISRDPSRKFPKWATDAHVNRILARLVLVGAWEDNHPGDSQRVSEFIGLPYGDITDILTSIVGDSPFVESGGVWRLVDPVDAATLLLPRLSERHLEGWGKFVEHVLLAEDPLEGLSPTESIIAQFNGARPPVSSSLRQHVVRGLALGAAICDKEIVRERAVGKCVDGIVASLLNAASQDDTGRVLSRLAPSLPSLAEASPNVFLRYLEDDLGETEPVTNVLFRKVESSVLVSTTSIHDLQWALECLCWSPDFFGKAARLLVKLADLAPGEKEIDYCLETLEKVVTDWARFSAGHWDDKAAVVKWALEEYPDVGWRLVETVLLSQRFFLLPYEPVYRDWNVEKTRAPVEERAAYIHEVLQSAIPLAECRVDHWLCLLSVLESVPHRDRLMVVEALQSTVSRGQWDADELLEVWLFIKAFVGRHEASPQATWALNAEQLQPLIDGMSALELRDDPRRFAWLFDDKITITIDGLSMWDDGFSDSLHKARTGAIDATLNQGFDQLRVLVEYVKNPFAVGQFLAQTGFGLEAEVLAWLAGESPALREAASTYIRRIAERRGALWARAVLNSDSLALEGKKRFVVALPAEKEYWGVVDELGSSLSQIYWENMNVFLIKDGEGEEAVERLLEHGCASQTISLLVWMLHDGQELVVAQVVEAMSGLIESSGQKGVQDLSYEVAELLTWLERETPEHPGLPMLEFQFFDYVFDHEPANTLYEYLGNSPDRFVFLVKRLFSAHDDEMSKEAQSAYLRRCWSILYHWQRLPGLRDDGTIDGEHLTKWINDVRTRLNADGNERDYDSQIGEVLASSPDGKDGMWPAEEVRDLLEALRNPKLEAGLFKGRLNRRGVTTRGVFDGGAQETHLAEHYREDSRKMSVRWPRTAAVLDGLAEEYELEAKREDEKAEERADQD